MRLNGATFGMHNIQVTYTDPSGLDEQSMIDCAKNDLDLQDDEYSGVDVTYPLGVKTLGTVIFWR